MGRRKGRRDIPQKVKFAALAYASGHPEAMGKDLAQMFGVCRATIHRWLGEAGISLPRKNPDVAHQLRQKRNRLARLEGDMAVLRREIAALENLPKAENGLLNS